ncbi:hypothetical protein [Nibribacter koreensis]|uniref:Dolichyl-phosphate-mannose-protein mannosyltransferase n=1 Tax=Nibribacter koreensis TaxID=1084519 RepID=A0ABP8FH39_9BACT
MELKDLLLAPLYLIIIYATAFWARSKYTNKFTKKYFIPALSLKLGGAISLGLIYQFYYGPGTTVGGDTGNYYHQAKIILSAFEDSIDYGIRLFFSNGEFVSELRVYTKQMQWYKSPTEYFIIKTAAIFGIISFGSYAVIAMMFAITSFSGLWVMFKTFLKIYPTLTKEFAIAIFFLPSVFFWGSGLMKDSLTLGALGWVFYGFYATFIEKKNILFNFLILFAACYVIYVVKVYILLSFLPPALYWVFTENNSRIKSGAIRALVKPIFIALGLVFAYLGATIITAEDEKYSLDKIGERTRINSVYLSEYQASGSAYHIGTLDGSIGSMISVAPQAIIVALYRPFLWEVRNPFMLLSAFEALLFIFLTLKIILKVGIFKIIGFVTSKPIITFCITFSLIFAFGVGTNSGNFGTLVRYKIPLMPFYLSALYIMNAYLKRPRNTRRLAATE